MRASSSRPLKGEVSIPGDKSISHRSLILGALAIGQTRIAGLLEGQDVLDTARAMVGFGAQVEKVKGAEFGLWSARARTISGGCLGGANQISARL